METNDDRLSAQQSLTLIESMIRQAKGKASGNSFYFLLWGWVIAVCNFGMYYLMKFSPYPNYAPAVWMLTIPAWVVTMIYGARQGRSQGIISHLDQVNKWLWIAMAITITPAWLFGEKINWMVNAIILMPVGAATFVSGVILKFLPLRLGGIVFWAAGILCYFLDPVDQYLVGGFAIILGYLFPGYLLRSSRE
ncbi:MAG: hypothetical protein JNN04_11825 [Cyclobacteriaceae bacterium]|nr:hypothetical protein [Cyclobacteriaceae bacterium]